MKIALMGTRGAPARYGGFETAVEEIGAGLAARGHDVVIYCRAPGPRFYRGMRRVVLPALHRKALETLTHTGVSTLHTLAHRPDAAFVFNAANAPYVATLRACGIPTALHIDGHDSKRAKWSAAGQRYYTLATRIGSAVANVVIVDSAAIGRELVAQHEIKTVFVPYGARETTLDVAERQERLDGLGLQDRKYHLVVARFEPENHVLEIVQGYERSSSALPLVVVGFAGFPGEYTRMISAVADADPRVRLTGAIWDQELLDSLYAGAATYLHGHSVGGTNPSLLRAMAQGTPVVAFDCPYNRETTGGHGTFFTTLDELPAVLESVEIDDEVVRARASEARARAAAAYTWSDVVSRYEAIAERLVSRDSTASSPRPARADD